MGFMCVEINILHMNNVLEEGQKMTEKSIEMLDRMRKSVPNANIKNATMLHRAEIITRNEARCFLGLDPINDDEFQSSSPKFQLVKSARNRYDYLKRKLHDGKYFTKKDEKDFIALHKMFEEQTDQNEDENYAENQNSVQIQTEFQQEQSKVSTGFVEKFRQFQTEKITEEKFPQNNKERVEKIVENIKKVDVLMTENSKMMEENAKESEEILKNQPKIPKTEENKEKTFQKQQEILHNICKSDGKMEESLKINTTKPKKWISMEEFSGMVGVETPKKPHYTSFASNSLARV